MTAAHLPNAHHLSGKGYHDDNPGNGRILDIIDHSVEEVLRNNVWGAKQLLKFGVYTIDEVRKTGVQWYPTIHDIYEYIDQFHEELEMYRSMYLVAKAT